jgi:hypothetical protein
MEGLIGWLFIMILLTLVSAGGRSDEAPNPSVVVVAAPTTARSGNGAIVFLVLLWLLAYLLAQAV